MKYAGSHRASYLVIIFLLVFIGNGYCQIDIGGKVCISNDEIENYNFDDFINMKTIDEIKKANIDEWILKDWQIEINNYFYGNWETISDSSLLMVYKNNNGKLEFIGGYCFVFGGKGANIIMKNWSIKDNKTIISIECIGYMSDIGIDHQIVDLIFED